MKKGFTLIELLVVVAIVAVIGAGVAVYYGHEVVDNAKRQMTLHEMGQIRDAFQRFYADNAGQLMDGLTVADTSTALPDGDFSFISTSDGQTYQPPTSDNPQRLYGVMQFFERYGLWPLLRKSICSETSRTQVRFFLPDSRQYEFRDASPTRGDGWHGPYIATSTSGTNVVDGVIVPYLGTKYEGQYRIIYFEHCPDESAGQPIYRRLLLMAAEKPTDYDTEAEIARFRGNRRYSGSDAAPPIDVATGAITAHDAAHGVFFLELLNFDTVYR